MLDVGASGVPDTTSHFLRNSVNVKFKVLHDECFTLAQDSSVALVHRNLHLSGYNKKIYYTPGSTTTTGNGLWYLFLSDSGIIPNPAINASFRVTFKDSNY